jgi:tetratricopeptide (TPR) repeat protein
LLCVLAVLCRLQVRYWQNTETLFRHALRVTKDNWIAHYNLGFTLAQSGRIPESLGHFEEAVRIKPEYLDAQYNLGLALTLQGRASEAVASWEQALRIEPRDTKTQNSLARVLAMLPRSEGGNPARAVSLARQACQLNHNRVSQDLDTLAIAYASAGQFDDAITTGQKALELARSTGRWQMAGELEGRLEMYRSGRAPTVR